MSIIYSKILYHAGFRVKNIILKSENQDIFKFLPTDIEKQFINSSSRVRRYLSMVKIILKESPDVVFSSATALSSVLVITGLFKRKMKVITRQCFTPGTKSQWVERTIATLFNYADINIAQTEEMKEEMILKYHLNPKKLKAIYNPLDVGDIMKKTKGVTRKMEIDYSYVAVGRFDPQKDYVSLIKAFQIVVKQKPSAHLTIIGSKRDIGYYNIVTSLIDTSCLNLNISLVDYTDNPFKYELASNCFVLSSITEGLPNVLLEAMFLNIPCVSTRSIPFIGKVIKNGINGYTVKVGDIQTLAEAMLEAPKLIGKVSNTSFYEKSEREIIKAFSE